MYLEWESTHVVLCELDLDDFWVAVDGFLGVQQLLGVGQPGHQLCQGVLELAQRQQGGFQLVLGKDRDGKGEFERAGSAAASFILRQPQVFTVPVCEQSSRPSSPRDV